MRTRPLLSFILLVVFILANRTGKASEPETISSTPQNGAQIENIRLIGLTKQHSFGKSGYGDFSTKKPGHFAIVNSYHQLYTLPDSLYRISILPPDRSGRNELIISSVALTIFYYGWAIPTALNAEGGRAYVASYMLLGGASYFVPFLATRSNQISSGMARGFSTGGLLGITHGWAFAIGAQGDEIEPRLGLGTSVVTSLLEAKLLMGYARAHNHSQGHMSMIGSLGLWGGVLAVPLPIFADSESSRIYAASYLAGSGIGMWAGDQLANIIPVDEGDAQIMSTAGMLGGLVGFAILNSISDDFTKASLATLLTTTAGGLGYGFNKIKQHNYSQTDAQLISLGSLAGGLIGLGAIYVSANDPGDAAYLWGASAGALGGFFLTEHLVKGSSETKFGKLNIRLNPLAFRQFMNPIKSKPETANLQGQQYLLKASLQF